MAWYDAGNGAGVWSGGIVLNPSLKNILHQLCTAINEREIYRCHFTSTRRKVVSSITRSGSTATVSTSTNHNLETGDYVYVRGADQSDYNGLHQITKTGNTTFTYAVSNTPATPATGTMRAYAPATRFIYNENGDTKHFPAVADFVDMPITRLGTGPERNVFNTFTPTSLTFSGGVVTVTTSSANVSALTIGDPIDVSGADQAPYNGAQVVASKPTATTFTYAIAGSPASPATGTIEVRRHGSITRDGSVATVHLPGHALPIGGKVTLSGATQNEYNGEQTVTGYPSFPNVSSITRSGSTATMTLLGSHGLIAGDVVVVAGCSQPEYNGVKTVLTTPTTDTFTYTVSGTPATPATGSPTCRDISRFTFTVSGTPTTPASGNIKATCARHMVPMASYSGGTGTFYCYDHGFANGDYVEIVPAKSGFTDWSTYGAVSGVTTHTFQLAMADPTTDDFEYNSSGTMHVVRAGVFRRLMRQIQDSIEDLATSPGSLGARFVEDDGTYDTAWTITNLLDDTTAGSPWWPMENLLRADLGSVFLQMREAIDLLTHVHFGVAQISTFATHDEYLGDDSVLDDAWDEAVADTPTSINGGVAPRRAAGLSLLGVYSVTIDDNFLVTVEYRSPNIGTFVEGSYTIADNMTSNSGSNSVDAFDVEDKDGNATTLDVAAPVSPATSSSQDKEVAIDNAWMTDGVAFDFTLAQVSIPSSTPLSISVGSASRSAGIDVSDMRFIRELVPGTHLTYG